MSSPIADSLIFSMVSNCRDTVPVAHTATWWQFAEWLDSPRVTAGDSKADKDGTALIFASFHITSRTDRNVSAVTALPFDIEQGHSANSPAPAQPGQIAQRLREMDVAFVLWSTFSHQPDSPRMRLVLPVSEPFDPAYLADALHLTAQRLGIEQVMHRSCVNPSRLMYAPAVPKSRADAYQTFHRLDVPAVDMGELTAEILDLRESRRVDEEANALQALKAQQTARLARRLSGESRPDVIEMIRQFNRSTSVEAELTNAGYRRRGKRWIAPTSRSGVPGATILTGSAAGKAFSFHEGDPLNDGRPHDAFDIWAAYHFNGDRTAAISALRKDQQS